MQGKIYIEQCETIISHQSKRTKRSEINQNCLVVTKHFFITAERTNHATSSRVSRVSHVEIPIASNISIFFFFKDNYLSVIVVCAWDCGSWQRVISVDISSFGSILNTPLHTSLNVRIFVGLDTSAGWIFSVVFDWLSSWALAGHRITSLLFSCFHSTSLWRKLTQHSRNVLVDELFGSRGFD